MVGLLIRKGDCVFRGPSESSAAHASSNLIKRGCELPQLRGGFHVSRTCSASRTLLADGYAEVNLFDPTLVRHPTVRLFSATVSRHRCEYCTWRLQPWGRQRAVEDRRRLRRSLRGSGRCGRGWFRHFGQKPSSSFELLVFLVFYRQFFAQVRGFGGS